MAPTVVTLRPTPRRMLALLRDLAERSMGEDDAHALADRHGRLVLAAVLHAGLAEAQRRKRGGGRSPQTIVPSSVRNRTRRTGILVTPVRLTPRGWAAVTEGALP